MLKRGQRRPPVFDTVEEERLHRKQRLAATFRLFSRFGFDEGVFGGVVVELDRFSCWPKPRDPASIGHESGC